MKPILYHSNENEFNTNGIGILSDCTMCEVTEELNGEYELQLKYPIDGLFFGMIKMRSIIVAKPNMQDDPQPFRVYRITKPMSGVVTVYAHHISYDATGIPLSPFEASNVRDAMENIQEYSAIDNPFIFYTDMNSVENLNVAVPTSVRSVIGGENSLLSTYGGELFFDKYHICLLANRGEDRGVKIKYGKNLTDLKQEENVANTYTGIYPYYTDNDGGVYELPEKIIHAEGNFDFERIATVDLTRELGDVNYITIDDVRLVANQYMESHKFGVPEVSIDVSFINLADTVEYKNIAKLEEVTLGDVVEVEFEKLGVSAKAKCSKTIFDVLKDKYKSVIIGEVKRTIADSFADVPSKDYVDKQNTTTKNQLAEAIKKATELLNGANGGAFEILDENNDGINDATIWKSYDEQQYIKVTKDGFGLTVDGGKTYIYAITPNGLNADAINAGKVSAERIDTDDLFAKNLNLTGTFEASALAFFNPEQPELERLYKHLLRQELIPESEYYKWDFNNDGNLSAQDLLIVQKCILGQETLENWSGAIKTTVKVVIDLTEPSKAIKITGVNMWGRTIEKFFGINSLFADDNIEATFAELLLMSQPYIEQIEKIALIEERTTDSGWIRLELSDGISTDSTRLREFPSYRKIGNHVFIEGCLSLVYLKGNRLVAKLPSDFAPSEQYHFFAETSGHKIGRFFVNTSGNIYLEWIFDFNGTETEDNSFVSWINLKCNYFVD